MFLLPKIGNPERLISKNQYPLTKGVRFCLLPNQYSYTFMDNTEDDTEESDATEEIDESNLDKMITCLSPRRVEPMQDTDQTMYDATANSNLKRKAAEALISSNEHEPKHKKTKVEPPATSRPRCPYGTTCYRTNVAHKRDCSHPGDPDYDTAATVANTPNSSPAPKVSKPTDQNQAVMPTRPRCQYGAQCTRKNVAHKMECSHPSDPDWATAIQPSPTKPSDGKPQAKNLTGLSWSVMGTPETVHVLNSPYIEASHKIAGFDMDGTLIETKSGNTHPKDRSDWKWWSPAVKITLQKLINRGFKIVIFTNQGGIKKNAGKGTQLRGKIIDICQDFGYPIQVLMAEDKDVNRKPQTTMWDLMVNHLNGGVPVDLDSSFYIGDAAGRPAQWKPGLGKDFSCSDRKFAANVGINFQTPEEFFDGEAQAEFDWGGINPAQILETAKSVKPFKGTLADLVPGHQEMVVMVGMPASGKSSFSKKYLVSQGYEWVNRDTLKTPEKCLKVAGTALENGKCVVIDNTNPDKASRAKYISLARKHNVPCRCFVMTTPRVLAEHLNAYRVTLSGGKTHLIPGVAYNVFEGKFEEPKTNEGFEEIMKINFTADFRNEAEKKLFKQWS